MPNPPCQRLHRLSTTLLLVMGLSGSGCAPPPENKLQEVIQAGELVVVTRNSPTTYYEGPDGPTGFEYDLVRAFAKSLGVSVRMKTIDRFSDILPMIANGDGDLAAAGITVTPQRATQVRFSPYYQQIRQQVIHSTRTPAPTNAKALIGRSIEVVAGTSYVERLESLREKYPKLKWTEVQDMETEELLIRVQEGQTEITIADSNIVALNQQYNPDLRVGFNLSDAEKLAWAFPLGDDNSLFDAASRFIDEIRTSGELAHLIERHYGAATRFNPINIAAFLQKIETDLSLYKPMFEEAGRRYALDWRLLAAMSYQESYWNPKAVSPTGVRGIMMLTEITAQHLRIKDRLDPRQSILGGGAYLRQLIDRLPSRIHEPDRSWMALAAYNVGFNHLEDARIITQIRNGDPDKWSEVKESLPLLTKAVWHSRTRHGYARGYEPVQFVTRIRTYYEVLKKTDEGNRNRNTSDALRLRAPAL
jgi:membrane-bound lytic murein transglycosylase F